MRMFMFFRIFQSVFDSLINGCTGHGELVTSILWPSLPFGLYQITINFIDLVLLQIVTFQKILEYFIYYKLKFYNTINITFKLFMK